jgi:hypothetical protein
MKTSVNQIDQLIIYLLQLQRENCNYQPDFYKFNASSVKNMNTIQKTIQKI